MMFFPTGLIELIISLISGYALSQSYVSIKNIKKYESRAEKAAEWSDTAKTRLWDTRYTIGTGAVSCLLSLLTALVYLVSVPSGASIFSAPMRSIWPALLSAGLHFGASQYMRGFWVKRAKMPMLDQYNDAISQSMEVIGFLDMLAVGWGMMAVLKVVGL